MTTVKVTLELTAAEAWFLADKAETAGLELPEWIRTIVTAGHGNNLSTAERVRLFNKAGMTDGEIAVRLNTTRLVVSQHRRSAGLKPRKRLQSVTKPLPKKVAANTPKTTD